MNTPLYIWNEFFEAKKVAKPLKGAYLKYINRLNYKDLPVIFELEHLSAILGIKYAFLRRMVNKPEAFYYSFTIPKRSGGDREINAPFPIMRYAQFWILHSILKKIDLHESAYAYRDELSIIDNAKVHLGKKFVLKMDLEDFFPSISIKRIIPIFQFLGYSNQVSFHLASLCCFNSTLPQGACTSPYLSNIVLKRLDKKLKELSFEMHFSYSRYADDLTFSGNNIDKSFTSIVKQLVEEEGFKINEGKTLLLGENSKKIVTGISVSGHELKLPKATRRKLRQEFHFIKKLGIDAHKKNIEKRDPIYLERIIGKFNFWLQIEPENEYIINALVFLKKLRQNRQ